MAKNVQARCSDTLVSNNPKNKPDGQIIDNLRSLIRHDIQSKVEAQASKTHSKLEKLTRHVGALHVNLCRASLGRNIKWLACSCNALEGFTSFDARISWHFVCVQQICDHLQLKPCECTAVQKSLLNLLKSDANTSKHILTNFLQILLHKLERQFSKDRGRWPKYALTIEEVNTEVSERLSQSVVMIADVISKLRSIQDIGKSNVISEKSSLHCVIDHVEDIIHLLSASQGPEAMRELDIMNESWGLILLFWVLNGSFRHSVLEVDVRGTAIRNTNQWKICFGEIKSSDDTSINNGRKQLVLVHGIFALVLRTASPEYTCEVTKCLFLVNNGQRKGMPLTDFDGDVLIVNISQLPY